MKQYWLLRAFILLAALTSGCGGGSESLGVSEAPPQDNAGKALSNEVASNANESVEAVPRPDKSNVSSEERAFRPLAASPFARAINPPSSTKKYTFKFGDANHEDGEALLNEMKSAAFAGYIYVETLYPASGPRRTLYRSDGVTQYAYKLLEMPLGSGNPDGVFSATNALNSDGYSRITNYLRADGSSWYIYAKPSTATSAVEISATILNFFRTNLTTSEVLGDLNSKGAEGYCSLGRGRSSLNGELVMRRYVPAIGRCQYITHDAPLATEQLLAAFNMWGASGYAPFYTVRLDFAGTRQIFVKYNSFQNSRFTYYLVDPGSALSLTNLTDVSKFLDISNREGAKGALLYGYYSEGSVRHMMFRLAEDCSGPLCEQPLNIVF